MEELDDIIVTKIEATVLRNIMMDRGLSELPTVRKWELFDRTYSGIPTHIGEVDVRYNKAGHCAIYGFDCNGNVECYMD